MSISNEIFIRKLWTRRRFKQNLSDQRDICHMLVKDRFTRRNNWVPYYTCEKHVCYGEWLESPLIRWYSALNQTGRQDPVSPRLICPYPRIGAGTDIYSNVWIPNYISCSEKAISILAWRWVVDFLWSSLLADSRIWNGKVSLLL